MRMRPNYCHGTGLGSNTPTAVVARYGFELCPAYLSCRSEVPNGDAPQALQLWDWDGARRVGAELPAPIISPAWDPSLSLVALAYPTQV